jgi:hypothetical protein
MGQKAKVADAHEAGGKHVEQEAAQELLDRQGHQTLLVAVRGVSPAKGDLVAFQGDQAVIGDRRAVGVAAEITENRLGAGRRTILCDSDPTFVLYRIAQRFGLPVVPEWAGWFNEEINRRGAFKPLIGLGCSPVLVSGTKKLFLKWIRNALRQKRIEVPDCNGPVRWSLAHSFFRINPDDLDEGTPQGISEETTAIKAEEAASCESS